MPWLPHGMAMLLVDAPACLALVLASCWELATSGSRALTHVLKLRHTTVESIGITRRQSLGTAEPLRLGAVMCLVAEHCPLVAAHLLFSRTGAQDCPADAHEYSLMCWPCMSWACRSHACASMRALAANVLSLNNSRGVALCRRAARRRQRGRGRPRAASWRAWSWTWWRASSVLRCVLNP